jgi:alpha-D-ribose 1-methylphosphonate 5-triphosphate synthase subunit PhnH
VIAEEDQHRAFRSLLEALARPARWFATPAHDAERALDLLRLSVWDGDQTLVVTDQRGATAAFAGADVGTEEEPERGATVVVVGGEEVTPVTVEGPGVAEPFEVNLPLARAAIEARQAACSRYPLGVDTVLIDAQGRVLGLPRTTLLRCKG